MRRRPPLFGLVTMTLISGAVVLLLLLVPYFGAFMQVRPSAPPVPVSAPLCPSVAPHFYADNPVDRQRAGPGSAYKALLNDFGPSAVPTGYGRLRIRSTLGAVRDEYLQRLCADKKLFRVGFMSLDVNHLVLSPLHPAMNPNAALNDERWHQGVETYFSAIRWDLSRIEQQTIPAGSWTLLMVPRPGNEPLVRAVMRLEASASHVLVLAITQPDGSLVYQPLRLECGFQPIYSTLKEVPAVLQP